MTRDEIVAMADAIEADLRKVGTKSRDGHRPSKQIDFGVYTPDLRAVVKAYKPKVKSASGEAVYDLALELLHRNIRECRQVGYELVEWHKAARESLTTKRLEALAGTLDNWADVDSICCGLVGRAWREGRITDAAIDRWSRSPDRWWRRAAVVATVALNIKSRGGTGDTPRTIRICERLVADRDDMVEKAISWALRELIPWDRPAVEAFLATHNDVIAARVRREVTRKLTTGKKN